MKLVSLRKMVASVFQEKVEEAMGGLGITGSVLVIFSFHFILNGCLVFPFSILLYSFNFPTCNIGHHTFFWFMTSVYLLVNNLWLLIDEIVGRHV